MKIRLINLCILLQLLSIQAIAGKSLVWPSVEYSYAKAYLYNLNMRLGAYHSIIKDGKLDKSVEGEGIKLNEEQLQNFDAIFSSGPAIDMLINGFSECFIPRHAIVYYDQNDKPVAWMSVCFQCEGIRFYSPGYPRNHFAETPELMEEALLKLDDLRLAFASLGFFTDYPMAYNPKPDPDNEGSMYITGNAVFDTLFPEKITSGNYSKYIMDTLHLKENHNTEITAGGTRYEFLEITKDESNLLFSGRGKNISLEKAKITKNDILLSEKVHVGMTLDEIQSLSVYDGIAYPELISFKNEEGSKKIDFHFSKGVLIYYELEITSW